MNVNVKNPTKPYSAPPYIQEKTDKRVSSFLLEYYKNLIHFYGAQKIWCVFGATEGGDVTLLHIGLRDYHEVNGTFWEAREHYGVGRANVSV